MSTISHDDIGQDLRRIVITGTLDTAGANSVASKLAELAAAPKKNLVIDLTGIRFLASIGIGALISCAKTVKARDGKLALVVDPASTVMMSLEATGVDQLIPVFKSSSDAERAALA